MVVSRNLNGPLPSGDGLDTLPEPPVDLRIDHLNQHQHLQDQESQECPGQDDDDHADQDEVGDGLAEDDDEEDVQGHGADHAGYGQEQRAQGGVAGAGVVSHSLHGQ